MYAEMVGNNKAGWKHCQKINTYMLRLCETARQDGDNVINYRMYAGSVRNSKVGWRQFYKVKICMLTC